MFNDGVTWIGRGSFIASTRAQLLCSRRQACFKLTETGLSLECHGINPLLFVVCRSRDFNGTEVRQLLSEILLVCGAEVHAVDYEFTVRFPISLLVFALYSNSKSCRYSVMNLEVMSVSAVVKQHIRHTYTRFI